MFAQNGRSNVVTPETIEGRGNETGDHSGTHRGNRDEGREAFC